MVTLEIEYIPKNNARSRCQVCTTLGLNNYIARPSVKGLVDWKQLVLCKNCARKEYGSKNKIKWEKMHEKKDNNNK